MAIRRRRSRPAAVQINGSTHGVARPLGGDVNACILLDMAAHFKRGSEENSEIRMTNQRAQAGGGMANKERRARSGAGSAVELLYAEGVTYRSPGLFAAGELPWVGRSRLRGRTKVV